MEGGGKSNPFRLQAMKQGWVWAQREWSKATDDTGVGNPAHASAEKGRRYLDACCQQIAAFLVELARADIKDLYER